MGDFDDPPSLAAALAGVEVAYLVCTPDARMMSREVGFIRAARRAGVRHIVKCSAFGADLLGPSQILRAHATIEAELAQSGLSYTVVRPHGFMQTFTLLSRPMIEKAGAISLPGGDGGIPLIDLRDVAEVVIRALTEDGHDKQIYDVTGPEILSLHAQAEVLSNELGRPIHYIPGHEWQLVMMMRLLGVPPYTSEHALVVFDLQRRGLWELTTTTLHDLGIKPRTYSEFVSDLFAGRTGGGSSFEPPRSSLNTLIDAVMPPAMKLYLRMSGYR